MSIRRFDRVMLVATVVVIAGIGLCLFHTNGAAERDFCPASIVMMTALLTGLRLAPVDRLLPAVVLAYPLISFDLPSPPPKA